MYLKPDWKDECVFARMIDCIQLAHRCAARQYFFLICFALLPIASLLAQDTRVVVECAKQSTSTNPVVLIKWYSRDIIYNEGVNVYRKPEGSLTWTKISDKPIVRKANVSAQAVAADPDMDVFVTMIKSATKKDLTEGMFVFNVVIKSFQSNDFADFMGIYLEDKPGQPGKYEYKVNRIHNGKEVILGVSPVVDAGEYRPSPPIEGIELFQKGKKLHFNWKHDEERFYAVNVYRKSSKDAVVTRLNINPIMLSQVTDSAGNVGYPKPMFSEDRNLKENESYTYQLAGVGFFNNETQLSEPVRIKLTDVTPPPAPQNFQAKADSMKVHLKWENVPVGDLLGLNIHRSVKSDGPYEVINKTMLSAQTTTYHDTVTIPGPYYYFVSSNDTTGNQGHSDLMFVEVQDVFPPLPPEGLEIKADTGRISLSWKMGAEPDLGGYYIYRTVDRNQKTNYVLLNAEPIKADHFSQELPKNVKNEFFYYLIAVDTSYNRSKPSAHVSGRMPDILAPEKPFIKTVFVDTENLVVEWIRNVDADLAGYHIYRADTSKRFERVNINLLGRETFRFTDRDNAANTDYYYYLVALDSAGNISKPSKEKYGRRVVKEEVVAGAIELKIRHSKRKKQNQLSWKYATQASAPMGYVVYRGDDEKRLTPISGLIKEKTFVDKGASKDAKQRFYQVRAYQGENVVYSSVIRQSL